MTRLNASVNFSSITGTSKVSPPGVHLKCELHSTLHPVKVRISYQMMLNFLETKVASLYHQTRTLIHLEHDAV
jgi:hypothetical protein